MMAQVRHDHFLLTLDTEKPGKYLVLDSAGKQVGTYKSYADALDEAKAAFTRAASEEWAKRAKNLEGKQPSQAKTVATQ